MKVFFSKHKWKLLVAFVIFIIAIPLAINGLFKMASPLDIFAAEWEAGDALSFYGVILASVATILGVYFSIKYAQYNYRQDEANRVKPYFALTHYKAHSKSNMFSELPLGITGADRDEQLQSYYEEFKLQEVYIIVDQFGISFKDKLSDNQQQRLKSGGLQWSKIANGCTALQAHEFVSMPFETENVGSGAATNTTICFYKKGDKRKGASVYTVKQGNSFYFHVFCDDANIVEGNDYIIELLYGDIIGNYYSQKYPVVFNRDAETKRFCTTVNLSGKQEITDISTEDE